MNVISGTYCETIFYIRLKGPNILAESIQSEIQHATMYCQLEQELCLIKWVMHTGRYL